MTKLAIPTSDQLEKIYQETRNWGRFGEDDERGTLNFLTQERLARACTLARDGVQVSLAHDLSLAPSPESPEPAHHHMLAAGDARDDSGIPGYEGRFQRFLTNNFGC